MTHRDGQSMRRRTKSTHIADYLLTRAEPILTAEARRSSSSERAVRSGPGSFMHTAPPPETAFAISVDRMLTCGGTVDAVTILRLSAPPPTR